MATIIDKPFWSKETELLTIDKNKAEKIQVKICEKDDTRYIDIRTLKKDYASGDYLHTKTGICLSEDLYNQITEVINQNLNKQ